MNSSKLGGGTFLYFVFIDLFMRFPDGLSLSGVFSSNALAKENSAGSSPTANI